jgi:riboflavin kinase/FMN adenylyltransferase
MKLVRVNFEYNVKALFGSVVAIGNFDGCHVGHQLLLQQTKEIAANLGLPAVVVSFYPLPHEYFKHDKKKLMSVMEKYCFLRNFGLDYFYLLKFNKKIANLTAEQFVKFFLVDLLHVKHLVVGADFCFGKNRSGNVSTLTELGNAFGFNVAVINDYCDQFARVSSSRLRDALAAGEFAVVAKLLGREYAICGRVVHGAKLGRTLGFPTINIPLENRKPPLHGIYVVRIKYDDKYYYGAASVGTRPAVGGKQLLLEVNIFDFNSVIYGARVEVFFLHKVRDEYNFPSLDALTKQITADVKYAKDYLRSILGTIQNY